MTTAVWRSPRETLRAAGPWILAALCLLPLTWLLPPLDLTSPLAKVALWLSDSGKYGMPVLCAAALVVVVGRAGLVARRRAVEASALTVGLVLFLGVGAIVNEDLVKPRLNSPRPNIAELSARKLLPSSPDAFYKLSSKAERSAYLRTVLDSVKDRLPMAPAVREHWIEETGFSFPSGHSTAAMLVATLYACLAFSVTEGRRRFMLLMLLPWAVAVCYARPILRVHRPVDVTVGGLQGVVLGLFAFLFVYALVGRRKSAEAVPG